MRKKENLFCFFSGYTNNVNKVVALDRQDAIGVLKIKLTVGGGHQYFLGEYVQLNGVLCEVIQQSEAGLIVSTTQELIKNTSLERISVGGRLSLGRLVEKDDTHSELYTLQPTAYGIANFSGLSVLQGHQYTLKLQWHCLKHKHHLTDSAFFAS